VLVILGASFAGCGSSAVNGLASEQPADVIQAAVKALESSSSFHVSGSGQAGSSFATVSLNFYRDGDLAGSVTEKGFTIEVVELGPKTYIKAPNKFWLSYGAPATFLSTLNGRYVEVSSSQIGFGNEFSFSHLSGQLEHPKGTLHNLGLTNLSGKKVVDIESAGTETGQLYIAASGTSYPIEVKDIGSDGSTLVFSDWNGPPTPTPPAGAVPVG
jgi:hypothetical protein